ncbi:unnamed protein product, partial [Pocillopora meandrina]
MDKEIDYLLTKADLSNYTDNFKQIGVAKVEHFLDVDDETLERDIGLTKIQTRRLRRFFAQIQGESKQRGTSSEGVTSASAPKKRKQAILSFGRSGQLQVLRNDSAPEKKPWEKYLLPNPHTERLKFYNSVVPQIYESSFVSKQAGFKQYLLEQQQMRWQLNTKIKALSDKENNL